MAPDGRDSATCAFCTSIECSSHAGTAVGESVYHDELFHSPCERCFEADRATYPGLCQFCRHLRLPHLGLCFEFKTPCIVEIKLRRPEELHARGSCSFCRFLFDAISTHRNVARLSDNDLWGLKPILKLSSRSLGLRLCSSDDVLLCSVSISIFNVGTTRASSIWRKLLNLHRPPPDTLGGPSRYIDWTNARVWIEQCPSPHGLPRNLKVIDVLQNRVVDAPAGCRYLALSYVFGGVKAEHITLPDALPATIGDAIIACQKLGVQYLWVDQLCISQKNSCVLQEQINQMHDIYQHAVCSLVALTGENSNCGLPGVTRSRPQVQNVVEIAGFMFTSLMPNIHDCIKFSKWATRGWTLQEAIFSDCFLFFTDYGLHFVQRNAVGIKRAQIKSDVISGVPAEYTLPSKDKFWTMLGKYNARDLSYPEDALRAFSAVLRSTYGDNTYYGHPREQIDKAAVWHIAGDRTASRMRTMFPSWSWASNSGPIGFLKANAALAVWAAPEGSTDSGTNIILCTPAPDEDWGERGISRESRGLVKDHQIARRQNLFFTIDVAWEVGSIKCSRLFESGLHWSRAATLAERWPTYDAYWHSTLGNYDIDTIFPERDRATAASAEGRILLHGQTASFPLAGTESSLHKTGKLRIMSEDGMVAGVVVVPSYCEPAGDGEFVALSIGDIDGLNFRYDLYDFARSMGVSIDEFIEGLLFYDSTGNSIPPPWDASFLAARQCVIVLNVLLIERDEQSNVARRLGLGYVFLKRWVEAKPIFETIILE